MTSTSTARWFLVVLICLGLITWAATGNGIFLRLVYLSVALLMGAWLLSTVLKNGIHVERSARLLRASVGDYFEERFRVEVTTWLGCPWVEIENHSPIPGAAGSRLLTLFSKQETRFYIARTVLTQRGAFLLGPTVITTGDPFGLFPVVVRISASDTLIVLPKTYPIREFAPPAGLLPGGKKIRIRTSDVTPHAVGVREYFPGDPMKRIHWPSSARRGVLMVKEFEQDPQAEIWLFIDNQRNIHTREVAEVNKKTDDLRLYDNVKVDLPCDTFEYAVSAAGSLTQYFIHSKRAVGMACSSAKVTFIPSERGERQLGKILETLAFLAPDGMIPISGFVAMYARLLPAGSGVILVTTSDQHGVIDAVTELQRRSLRPFIVLIKSESFGEAGHDSEGIIRNLQTINIPVHPLKYGDDLTSALSLPARQLQRYHNAFLHKKPLPR